MSSSNTDADVMTLSAFLEMYERVYLTNLLTMTKGAVGEAASRGGINRRTLLRKMQKYRLNRKSFR